MFRVHHRQGRGLLVLMAVAALSVSACGGSSATPTPTAAQPTDQPAATTSAATTAKAGGLSGAAAAMANLTSYKFTMTLVGADFPDTLASVVNSADNSVPISGTVILKPAPAADITFAKTLRLISVDGYDYVTLDPTQGYTKNAQSTDDPSASPAVTAGPKLSDSISPASEFATMTSALNGFSKVGSENKNGVDCDHYQGSPTALAQFGSVSGVKNATWAADLWVASNGGYPVSMLVIAKAKDGTTSYEIAFDLTNINDAANKVTAPDNVTGA